MATTQQHAQAQSQQQTQNPNPNPNSQTQQQTPQQAQQAALVAQVRQQLSSSRSAEDARGVKQALADLVEMAIDGKCTAENVVVTLRSVDNPVPPSIVSTLVDLLWLWHFRVDDNKDQKKALVLLIKEFVKTGLVPKKQLLERLPQEIVTAEGARVVPLNEAQYRKKLIQINTNTFMRQQKFNLFREESEGYSKLITELNTNVTEQTIDKVLENVQSLVGYFDLDPNRVFDMVLESFEQNLQQRAFLRLVTLFPASYLPHILGFKFQSYIKQNEVTPKSLYDLVAVLIQNGLLTIEQIYPHLKPTDEELRVEHEQDLKETDQAAIQIGMSTLSMSAKDLKKERREKMKIRRMNELRAMQCNQKFGLIEALIDKRDWQNVDRLLLAVRPVCPGVYPPIASALCRRLHILCEPLYRPISPWKEEMKQTDGSGEPAVTTYESLFPRIFAITQHLGPYLHRDVILFCKFCRLMVEFLKNNSPDALKADLIAFIGGIMLPTLSMIPANPSVGTELWEAVRRFGYQERFQMYALWSTQEQHPVVTIARATARNEVRHILRSLTVPKVKEKGRQIAKLTHTFPDVIFERLVLHIRGYSNFIQPIVDCLKYITNLSFDVLNYVLICQLATTDMQSQVGMDGMNAAMWLSNIAQFAGLLYNKYAHRIEMVPIVQYTYNQLLQENSGQLIVLREITEKISNLFVSEDLYDDQLQMLASGPAIRADTLDLLSPTLDPKKRSARAVEEFSKALLTPRLSVVLYIVIAQRRASVLWYSEEQRLKVLLGQFDKLHTALLLYSDFLNCYILNGKSNLNKPKLPFFADLLDNYKLQPETAFHLIRDSLHLLYSDIRREGEPLSSGIKRKLVDDVSKVIDLSTVHITSEFYSLFWSLRLGDIYVPRTDYDKRIRQITDETVKTTLGKELSFQEQRYKALIKRLEDEKNTWFTGNATRVSVTEHILERCILPRALFSSVDSIFCAKFVKLLHMFKIESFSLVIYLQRIFEDLGGILLGCTEGEAARLGRFLRNTLIEVKRWKESKSTYDKECSHLSFASNDKTINHTSFVRLTVIWETKCMQKFCEFLKSGKFVQIRNTLTVLTKILGVYPSYQRIAVAIEEKVQPLTNDKRSDIKVMADSYRLQLQKEKPNLQSDAQFQQDTQQDGALPAGGSTSSPPSGTDKSTDGAQSAPPSARPSASTQSTSSQPSSTSNTSGTPSSSTTSSSRPVTKEPAKPRATTESAGGGVKRRREASSPEPVAKSQRRTEASSPASREAHDEKNRRKEKEPIPSTSSRERIPEKSSATSTTTSSASVSSQTAPLPSAPASSTTSSSVTSTAPASRAPATQSASAVPSKKRKRTSGSELPPEEKKTQNTETTKLLLEKIKKEQEASRATAAQSVKTEPGSDNRKDDKNQGNDQRDEKSATISGSHGDRKDERYTSGTDRDHKDDRSAGNGTDRKDDRSGGGGDRTERRDERVVSSNDEWRRDERLSSSERTNRTEQKDERLGSSSDRTERKDERQGSSSDRTDRKEERLGSSNDRTERKDERLSSSSDRRDDNKTPLSGSDRSRSERLDRDRSTGDRNLDRDRGLRDSRNLRDRDSGGERKDDGGPEDSDGRSDTELIRRRKLTRLKNEPLPTGGSSGSQQLPLASSGGSSPATPKQSKISGSQGSYSSPQGSGSGGSAGNQSTLRPGGASFEPSVNFIFDKRERDERRPRSRERSRERPGDHGYGGSGGHSYGGNYGHPPPINHSSSSSTAAMMMTEEERRRRRSQKR